MLSVELDARLLQAPLAEDVSVEAQQVVRQDLELLGHLAAVHLEACLRDDHLQLLIQRVVWHHQEVLGELFQDLSHGKLIHLAV